MSPEQETTVIGRLRELRDACGQDINKHDLAIVLIIACIEEGLNTRPRIVGALEDLGFNPKHVAIVLKHETGASSEGSRWQVNKEGTYSLLEEVAD